MKPPLDLKLLQAFILIVETGSISETARRIGRTQPAVSIQMQRLEEATGAKLFTTVGRKLVMTPQGEALLGYARAIMHLQDEIAVRLSSTQLSGRVVLGIPDLYASYLMPPIIAAYAKAHPDVEIELRCSMSSELIAMLGRDELDLALVTGMRGLKQGEIVAEEPLVWVASRESTAYKRNPLPLTLMPPGNVFRDFALASLETIGRRWNILCVSSSLSGMQAAIMSGAAVGVVAKSSVTPGMRELGKADSFPSLPNVDLALHRAGQRNNAAADAMGDLIVGHFARSRMAPKTRKLATQAGSGAHD